MNIHFRWIALLLAAVVLAFSPTPAASDDFRIESKAFVVGEAKQHENVTLFHGENVYDFSSDPHETTVLELASDRERFVLLNPAKQQKVEIKLDRVAALTARLRQAGAALPRANAFMNFAFNPQFNETWDDDKHKLLLDSRWMKYEATAGDAPTPKASADYRRFADWFGQLNAITSPTAMPPFARLKLNRSLDNFEQIPKNVTLTLKGIAPRGKDIVLTSTHDVTWKLEAADLERIRQTDAAIAKASAALPEEYFQNFDAVAQPIKAAAVEGKPVR